MRCSSEESFNCTTTNQTSNETNQTPDCFQQKCKQQLEISNKKKVEVIFKNLTSYIDCCHDKCQPKYVNAQSGCDQKKLCVEMFGFQKDEIKAPFLLIWIILLVFGILNLIGNALVICNKLYRFQSQQQTKKEIRIYRNLVFNLSSADFLMCIYLL